jgi:hypothetical protein
MIAGYKSLELVYMGHQFLSPFSIVVVVASSEEQRETK